MKEATINILTAVKKTGKKVLKVQEVLLESFLFIGDGKNKKGWVIWKADKKEDLDFISIVENYVL